MESVTGTQDGAAGATSLLDATDRRELAYLFRHDRDLKKVRLPRWAMKAMAGPLLVQSWLSFDEDDLDDLLATQRLDLLKVLATTETQRALQDGLRQAAERAASLEAQLAARIALACLDHPIAPEANPVFRILLRVSLEEVLATLAYRSLFDGML